MCDQGPLTDAVGRTVGELDVDDAASYECLAGAGCLDRASTAERQTCAASKTVRCQHIDRRAGTRGAVSDVVRAGEYLTEVCVDERLMTSGRAPGFDSQVDDDVDIIGGSRVERSSFDLEQKGHLSPDNQAVVAESWRQLDEDATTRVVDGRAVEAESLLRQAPTTRSSAAIPCRGSAESRGSRAVAPRAANVPPGMISHASSSATRRRVKPSGSGTTASSEPS